MGNIDTQAIAALLDTVAQEKGTTSEQVRLEMGAMLDATENGDSDVKALVATVMGHDRIPTLEELIMALVKNAN